MSEQIHYAASRGDQNAVSRQLDQGVSIDARDTSWGGTPLMWAAASVKAGVPMLSFLVSRGADVNATSLDRGSTAVRLAARNKEKMQYLLTAGADPFLSGSGSSKEMPRTESLEVLDMLLRMGFDPTLGGGRMNPTLLEDFARDCNWEQLRLCAQHGISLESLEWTPLMQAIILGSTDDVAARVQEGGDLTDTDVWRRTPLLLSICCGDVQKTKLILAAGAHLEERGRGAESPLEFAQEMAAEIFGDDALGRETLMAAVSKLETQGRYGESCLDCAILSRSSEMLEWLLLQCGIDPNLRGMSGHTPLMAASRADADFAIKILLAHGVNFQGDNEDCINEARQASTIRVLAEAGADINHVDGTGSFPLRAAAGENGNIDAVRCLIELGADVNLKHYRTALHEAALCDEIEIMKLLLDAGADPNATEQDYGEWTPLYLVKSDQARQLLIDAGADPES